MHSILLYIEQKLHSEHAPAHVTSPAVHQATPTSPESKDGQAHHSPTRHDPRHPVPINSSTHLRSVFHLCRRYGLREACAAYPSTPFTTAPCPTCTYTQPQRERVNYTNIQYHKTPKRIQSPRKNVQTFTACCRSMEARTRRRARARRSRWLSTRWTPSSPFPSVASRRSRPVCASFVGEGHKDRLVHTRSTSARARCRY